MALPLLTRQAKRRDQILAIDLGTRHTKAVHVQKRPDGFNLLGYTLVDAPPYERSLTPSQLADHFKAVAQGVGGRCRQALFVLGVGESILRHAEMPSVPVEDMRTMLKYNSKSYLQQELPDYSFDCWPLASQPPGKAEGGRAGQKCRVLVGGARRQTLEAIQAASKLAGLSAEQVVPSLVAPANSFEASQPDMFARECVALVDLGFRNSSISIVHNGELMLSRVVAIGGDRLTNGISESLGVGYAEAEGIKVGLPDEVQTTMVALLSPLGRELRASIDFFEHQHDKVVSQVLVSGGSARSDYIVQILQTELIVPCMIWNPTNFLNMALPPQQVGEIEQVGPQLAIAIGAALSAL